MHQNAEIQEISYFILKNNKAPSLKKMPHAPCPVPRAPCPVPRAHAPYEIYSTNASTSVSTSSSGSMSAFTSTMVATG